MPVSDGEQRQLFAFHEFFDQNFPACIAEDPIIQHCIDCPLRLRGALRDNDAFAGGETRSLYHHGRRKFSEGGFGLPGVAVLGGPSGGNAGATHQILGEALRSLDARCLARGAKDWKPARLEKIDDPAF